MKMTRIETGRLVSRVVRALLAGALLAACANTPLVRDEEDVPTIDERRAAEAIAAAQEAAAAFPGDPAPARWLVNAYLDARRFPEAFELAQRLVQDDSSSEESLVLLGQASFGLGLFDEAAACFRAALNQVQSDDTTWWLAYVLTARGDTDQARRLLDIAIEQGSVNWKLYELRTSIATDVQDQLGVLSAYQLFAPEAGNATRLGTALLSGGSPQKAGMRIVKGQNAVIQARLSDFYTASVKMNGFPVLTRLALGRSDLVLSEAAAVKLGLLPTGVSSVRGVGGEGLSQALDVVLDRVELGNLVLEQVPARVVRDLNTTDLVAELGTGILRGYSCRLDRKKEVLELFPPGMAVPEPAAGARIQPYYRLGDRIVTDAVLRNRTNDRRWKVKMALATDLQVTVVDRSYAHLLKIGKLIPIESAVLKDLTGYTRVTSVDMTELQFGGNQFSFDRALLDARQLNIDRLWTADLPSLGGFVPYGLIGRNVLSRYRVTLDEASHRLILETYR